MDGLILFALLGLGIYALIKNMNEREGAANEKPLISPHDMSACYGYVLNLLSETHRGDAWWSIRKASPEQGKIIAVIQWREFFGDQLGEMERRIVLTASFEPVDAGTAIYLLWEIHSPMHKGQVDEMIKAVKSAIRQNLNAA